MTAVVAPVDHKYVPPPVAVKLVDVPAHIVLLPEMLQPGGGSKVRNTLHVLSQPLAFDTVTL